MTDEFSEFEPSAWTEGGVFVVPLALRHAANRVRRIVRDSVLQVSAVAVVGISVASGGTDPVIDSKSPPGAFAIATPSTVRSATVTQPDDIDPRSWARLRTRLDRMKPVVEEDFDNEPEPYI